MIQSNQLLTELGNGDAKDRWQDALGHVLEANQTLKKVQSAVDRDGVTYPQLVQILMEATICEQDFDSIANFIDDKTWPQLFQHLRQAYYTVERVMDAVKGYRLGAVATADGEKILQVLRAVGKDDLLENKDTAMRDAEEEDEEEDEEEEEEELYLCNIDFDDATRPRCSPFD